MEALLKEIGEWDRRFRDEERRSRLACDDFEECEEVMRWRLRVGDEVEGGVEDEIVGGDDDVEGDKLEDERCRF